MKDFPIKALRYTVHVPHAQPKTCFSVWYEMAGYLKLKLEGKKKGRRTKKNGKGNATQPV